MEFPPVRRKLNTYGKGSRKILVHDIFGVTSSHSQSSSQISLSQPQSTPTGLSSRDPPSAASYSATISASTSDSHVSVQPSIDSSTRKQRSPSPSSASSPSSLQGDSHLSMFEIQSSDDEESALKHRSQPIKRRKVVPSESKGNLSASGKTVSKSSIKNKPAAQGLRRNLALEKHTMKQETLEPAIIRADPLSRPASVQLSDMKSAVRKPKPSPSLAPPLVPSRSSAPKSRPTSAAVSTQLSDDSSSSRLSRPTTPKRKRLHATSKPVDAPSPSDLHLTTLRLTPEAPVFLSQHISADEEMSDGDSMDPVPRKPRRRLVDRLDPPRPENHASVCLSTPPESSGRIDNTQTTDGSSPPRIPPPEAKALPSPKQSSGEGETRPKPPRVRSTYARQRSHLSDLAEGFDGGDGANSQHSSRLDLSQPVSFTSMASQMDFPQDDMDDGDLPLQKSIHELRRGGAISRFDNDLADLLDDISSSSKALRLTALMRLIRNLADLAFLHQFQEAGNMIRMAKIAGPELDEVTAVLLVIMFKAVTCTHQVSMATATCVLQALYRLPSQLASTDRTLARLARDRGQNLSKLLFKDIQDFEEERSVAQANPPPTVGNLFLTTLEVNLRRLKNREQVPSLPEPLVREIVSVLSMNWEVVHKGMPKEDIVENMRLCLSILEAAGLSDEIPWSTTTPPWLTVLREILASMVKWADDNNPEIQQVCLKFVINLSNDRPRVCSILSAGDLIGNIYTIIENHFLRIAVSQASKAEQDSQKLDTVILALGSMLNMTACSDECRTRMVEIIQNGRSLVEAMVEVFNSYFDQASEATSIEHAHIVVPLGYLSMLLCVLCLNQRAKEKIVQSTRGEGFNELFVAVETFLESWKQVEAEAEDSDGSSSRFLKKLTDIYETVKRQAA